MSDRKNALDEYTEAELEMLDAYSSLQEICREHAGARAAYTGYSWDWNGGWSKKIEEARQLVKKAELRKAKALLKLSTRLKRTAKKNTHQ